MFSVKVLPRLFSFFIVLAIAVGLAPAVQSWDEYDQNREEYRATEVDGIRLGFGDRQYYWDPGSFIRRQYTSGEPTDDIYAIIKDIGMDSPLENVKLTITFPKADNAGTYPQFPETDNAQRVERREDDSAYYADYYYDRIDKGADVRVPLEFSFKSGVTIPGDTYRPSLELFSDGNSIATAQVTFYANVRTRMSYDTEILEGINDSLGGGEISTPAHRFYVEDLETQGWRTPAEGIAITYRVAQSVSSSWEENIGVVDTDRHRFVVQLGEYTQPHPDSLADGWVHDPIANTLTYEANDSDSPCTTTETWSRKLCKDFKLLYIHAPVATDNTWNGPPKLYESTVETTFFNRGKVVRTKTDHLIPIAFIPDEIPRFKGQTHEITLEKWASTAESEGDLYREERLTVAEGNVYAGQINLGPHGENRQGMSWVTQIKQVNNGSELSDIATGGIKNHLHRIIEQDLDPRMYFHAAELHVGDWDRASNASLSIEQVKQRVNATSNVVWGVTASGEKREIARDIDLDQRIYMKDTARQYEKIEVEFTTPLEMDNYTLSFKVSALPNSEDLDKWERQEYTEDQKYPSTTAIEYVTDGDTAVGSKSATAEHTIIPVNRKHEATSRYTNVNIPYRKCAFDYIPGMQRADDPDCERYGVVDVTTLTNKDRNTWGNFDKPIANLRHVYLLPPGYDYAGMNGYSVYNAPDAPAPAVEIVENFKDTGRTAVFLNLGDVKHGRGVRWDYTTTEIRIAPTAAAPSGSVQMEIFAVWDNNDKIKAGQDQNGGYADVYDFDNDGDVTERFLRRSSSITFNRSSQVDVVKKVSVDGVNFVEGKVQQELNEPVWFEITVTNRSNQVARSIRISDILPSTRDFRWGGNVDGSMKPREWILNGEAYQHSGFNMPLTGPITDIKMIKDGVVRELPANRIVYSSYPQQGTFTNWVNTGWVESHQVLDWEQVVAFKLGQGVWELEPGERLVIRTKNVVRTNAPEIPEGSLAVNHASYSDWNGDHESLPVVVEIRNYRVSGVAFEDLDADGLRSEDDPLIANVPFTVVEADTGQPVANGIGAAITGTTDDKGHYSVLIPNKGEYRIRFEKKPGQVFASSGEGEQASHVAVCAPSADKLSGAGGVAGLIARLTGLGDAGATDDNCATGGAATNNFGWTKAFELNPTNGQETRNMGIAVPAGSLAIQKKDQHGEPVPGVEFTVTWKGATGETPNPLPAPKTGVTAEDGTLTFRGLPYGEYTLAETSTPAGYRGMTDPKDVVVTENTAPVEILNHRYSGQVVVLKQDETGSHRIRGAVFELRDAAGRVVGSARETNDEGMLAFQNLAPGNYRLVELQAAPGYALPDNPTWDVRVDADGQTVDITVKNKALTGSVSFTKVDEATGTPLPGAQFELRTEEGALVGTHTSGDNGVVLFNNVPLGRYVVTETQAPAGYKPLARPLTLEMTTAGQALNLGQVGNVKETGSVELTKVEAGSGQPIEGAEFQLRRGDDLVMRVFSGADGRVLFPDVPLGEYTVVEAAPAFGYLPNGAEFPVSLTPVERAVNLGRVENTRMSGSVQLTKVDQLSGAPLQGAVFGLWRGDQRVAVAESNVEGLVQFTGLAYGTYVLKETQAPAGYVLDPQSREITVNGAAPVDLGPVANVPVVTTVHFIKVDADTRQPVAGARFGLFNDRAEQVAEVRTEADGHVAFEKVRPGNYTVVELAAPTGYQRIAEPMKATVAPEGTPVNLGEVTNAKITGSVTLTKVDAATGAVLAGAVFELRQGARVIAEATTGEDGRLSFAAVPYGDYTVVEKTATRGYVREQTGRPVQVRDHNAVVDLGRVTNAKITGSVTLTKVDAASKEPLAGAVFELRQGEQVLAEKTTGEDGRLTFAAVPYGDYTVVEKTPPAGYQASTTPRSVLIREQGKEVDLGQVVNVREEQPEKTPPAAGTVVLTKVDAESKVPLAGAVFALKKDEQQLATVTSGADGRVRFEGLAPGEYSLVETTAPVGYQRHEAAIAMTVAAHGGVIDLGEIPNKKVTGTVTLSKVDEKTAKPVAGAVFELHQGDVAIAEETSGADGMVTFAEVPFGQYQLVEKAPAPGYVATQAAREVIIREHDQVIDLGSVTNTPIAQEEPKPHGQVIEFTKVDAESGQPLGGATFALLREGEELARATSGADGLVRFEVNATGTYTVREVAAPAGYQLLAEPIPVTPGATEVRVPNERIRGDIALMAVDKVTKRPVAGATFELVGVDGRPVAEVVSGADGKMVFTSQLWGGYTLEEIAEPAGYLPTHVKIPVSISVHGEVVDAGVVEYDKNGGTTGNPPGPGNLWKVFIPLIALVGVGSFGSSAPDPGPQPPVVPSPGAPQVTKEATPVVTPLAPAEEQPKAAQKGLAVTGSPVLPLAAIALVLVGIGALVLRQRS